MEHLKRDAGYVSSWLKEVGDQLLTTKPCKIQIPVRFNNRGLASIGSETYISGIYAIIIDDRYAVSNIPTMINITPTSTVTTTIRDEEYYEFSFDAGSSVIGNLNSMRRDSIIFSIADVLMIKGYIPWFFNENDIATIFMYADKYADSQVGVNMLANEIIASLMTRLKSDKNIYYRAVIKDRKDMLTNKPAFIGIQNTIYGPSNTLNKLAGRNFSDGVPSALINTTDTMEHIESLLRA